MSERGMGVAGKEKGSITIEATLVTVTCLAALFIMIGFGMVLYRQSLVTAAANQAASDVAMIYPYIDRDPNTGFTGPYDFDDPGALYRYFLWKAGRVKSENIDKAQWYANALLAQGSLGAMTTPAEVTVDITAGGALRRKITVTVTDIYEIPASDIFKMFGLPGEIEITAAATAQCVDMIDYMDTTNLLNYVVDKATPFSDLVSAVDKWITWAKKVLSE